MVTVACASKEKGIAQWRGLEHLADHCARFGHRNNREIMATLGGGPAKHGGYPLEIFEQSFDEKYKCNFCSLILRDPVQIFCGHRFCRSCIESHFSSGERCKQCEREGITDDYSLIQQDQMFPDNAVKREMSKLGVICPNPGCEWRGVFKEFEAHFNSCPFQRITCPDCGTMVIQNEFDQHKKNKCPERTADMDKNQVYEPLVTQLRELESDYKSNMPQMKEMIETISKEVQEMRDKIMALERQLVELMNRPVGGGAGGGGESAQNIDQKIRQAIEIQQGINNEKFQQLEVKTGTFEGIVSALHREIEKTVSAIERMEQNRRSMKETMEQNQQKIRTLERTLAVKDVSIAELELRVLSTESVSYDGTFIWKVPDFSKKQQDAKQGRSISIYSPPFFTSRRGYKMCARLYPFGDGMGKGSHLSLFFVVMRGHYDALQTWPFKQRVTFCLVNQNGKEHVMDSFRPDPNSTSFKRPTTDMNIASGCPLFLRLENLQNSLNGFIKDDTVFVKVMVDLNDPPLSEPLKSFEDKFNVTEIAVS